MLGTQLRVADPGVLHELISRDAGARVYVEYFPEQIFDFLVAVQGVRQFCEFSTLNLAEEVGFEFAKNRQLADIDNV